MRTDNSHGTEIEDLLSALTDGASLLSEATVRAYKNDWNVFCQFCETQNRESLPATPETVALFLLAQSEQGIKPATLNRRTAAIAHHHNTAGFNPPTGDNLVRRARRLIRRKRGTRQEKKRPLKLEELKTIVAAIPDTLIGKRDKAILLLGWAGGFRRSELAVLNVGHLTYAAQGILIQLERSKTDQEQQGSVKAIPYGKEAEYCPVMALKAWLEAADIKEGALFRRIDRHGNIGSEAPHPELIAEVVKKAVLSVGIDPARFGGHSLRSGIVSSAAEEGADMLAIMLTTGHRNQSTVQGYIREASLWKNNAATKAGL